MKSIVVDLYGGDEHPLILFRGVLDALKKHPDICVRVILRKEEAADFAGLLEEETINGAGLERRVTLEAGEHQILTNRDNPVLAASYGADYTITEAFRQLQSDENEALLSVGNTAAVLILSLSVTGLREGVTKPVLASFLPRYGGSMLCLLDCGANLEPSEQDLLMFARLGSESVKTMLRIPAPSVALLSVGKEEGKGTPVIKKSWKLLKESELHFIGNVEPDDLYPSVCVQSHVPDVVVCDGFSGNMILKNIEATGTYLEHAFRDQMEKMGTGTEERMRGQQVWEELKPCYSFNELGGAVLLGVRKPVMKAHGKASAKTIASCLEQCAMLCTGSEKDS